MTRVKIISHQAGEIPAFLLQKHISYVAKHISYVGIHISYVGIHISYVAKVVEKKTRKPLQIGRYRAFFENSFLW